MRVIRTMAIDATARRIFESRGIVTVTALSIEMRADQWKYRQSVIEDNVGSPTVFTMTTTAHPAKLLVMFVIGLMAGITVGGRT